MGRYGACVVESAAEDRAHACEHVLVDFRSRTQFRPHRSHDAGEAPAEARAHGAITEVKLDLGDLHGREITIDVVAQPSEDLAAAQGADDPVLSHEVSLAFPQRGDESKPRAV